MCDKIENAYKLMREYYMYSTSTYKVKHEGRATEVFHFELCIMEMFNIEE